LDVAEKTIRKWVLNKDIPYRKIHKLIRFRLSEIERWIESGCKLPLLNDKSDSVDDATLEAGTGNESGASLKSGPAVEVVAGD